MGAKNRVIAGEYINSNISGVFGMVQIVLGLNKKSVFINKSSVDSYEVITDEHRKSASSGIARGIIGGVLLGPVGILAGLSAKNKSIFTIAIKFKDGKSSLIEVDDKIYKLIVKVLF